MSQESATELVHALTSAGLTVATAESLTGGLLAGEIVKVSGASKVFTGGIVSYHTQLKQTLLGVDGALLAANGPVDPEVARQMADGARRACAIDGQSADLGLATTGVAGPDPDAQTGKTAGMVFLGIATEYGARSVELALHGDRASIRAQTVAAAISEALDELGTFTRPQSA